VKLVFNAEALRPPITGVGNYSYHLLRELVAAELVDEAHCFTGAGWLSGAEQLAATAAIKAEGAQLPGGRVAGLVRELRAAVAAIPGTKALYDAIMDRRFDTFTRGLEGALYHEPNYILKAFDGPAVTTVHDLSHLHFPHFHEAHVLKWLDALPESLSRADAIITVSDVVRRELLEMLHVPPERVYTIYEGVDEDYYPRTAQQTAPVLGQYDLSHGHYVLLVATLEPRKGVDVLLSAWEQLPESVRRDCPLALVGSSGWHNDAIMAQIQRLGADGTVRRLGYVPDAHLPALFAGASVFCYPSVYEGFGLPVLDAMASGVPVICRAGTSMAEFADGACVLCDSDETGELANRLLSLLDSADARGEWGERGRERARQFSWQRCAAQTAEVYRQVLEGRFA
jgi:alpha-1,3-rhamnosyl/mannosyltransferase